MQDGPDLLQEYTVPPEAGQAHIMIVSLEGFMDAGKAAAGAASALKQALAHRSVASFDPDQLVDYRSRRPPMTFTGRRFSHVAWPELAVTLISSSTAGFASLPSAPWVNASSMARWSGFRLPRFIRSE